MKQRDVGQDGRTMAGAANAVWIEAPWQPSADESFAALLLIDPDRRTVMLTRRLQLPLHQVAQDVGADTLAPTMVAALADRIAVATGCIVHGLRSLHRIDIEGGHPGASMHVLAVTCVQQAGQETDGVLVLDIDEAVHMADAGAVEDGATVSLLRYAQRHLLPQRPLTIVVAGPCPNGSDVDPALRAAQVAAMEACVLPLYEAGHLPVLGDWLALPTARLAGSERTGNTVYDRLLARCDGVLRIGGDSSGTDQMVATARRLGKAVYGTLDEVPGMRPRLVSDHPMLLV